MVESWGETHLKLTLLLEINSTLQGSNKVHILCFSCLFWFVGIVNHRYAIVAGLFVDLIGIIAAILVATYFLDKTIAFCTTLQPVF